MESYFGVIFSSTVESFCSVADCYFVDILDRAIFFKRNENMNCRCIGCIFSHVGYIYQKEGEGNDEEATGGTILFVSTKSSFVCKNNLFLSAYCRDLGFFIDIKCYRADVFFCRLQSE